MQRRLDPIATSNTKLKPVASVETLGDELFYGKGPKATRPNKSWLHRSAEEATWNTTKLTQKNNAVFRCSCNQLHVAECVAFRCSIASLVETGLVERWKQVHYPKDGCAGAAGEADVSTHRASVSEVLGIFIMLTAGLALALSVLALELFTVTDVCKQTRENMQKVDLKKRLTFQRAFSNNTVMHAPPEHETNTHSQPYVPPHARGHVNNRVPSRIVKS